MASKAARMARRKARASGMRGGHNKREDVARYPSGRIDYRAQERRESAAEVRARHFGLSKADAQTDRAGSVFGRMALQGEVTEDQYLAGREFEKRRAAYLRAIAAPPSSRSGSDIGYIHERVEARPDDDDAKAYVPPTEDEYVEQCRRAKHRFAVFRRAVMEADPLGLMALETIVCEDKRSDKLAGSLRIACNAVGREIERSLRRSRKAASCGA